MLVVSDAGMDLTPEQREGLTIHQIPLTFHLDGKSYRSGIDVQAEGFYKLLETAEGMPTTSQPSPGDFAVLYQELARTDPEILSVHISSGLSGTLNAAREGAKLVPEVQVTLFDTMTLSGAEGWQIEAAARAARAGWTVAQTLPLLEKIRAATETVFTLPTLKYLIHGGRISHIRGLLATVLDIKPIIGVSKEDGKYYDRGKKRTMKRAVEELVNIITEDCGEGRKLRMQVLHANDPQMAEELQGLVAQRFTGVWLPQSQIAPVLGAHTGAGLVGVVYAPLDQYPELP